MKNQARPRQAKAMRVSKTLLHTQRDSILEEADEAGKAGEPLDVAAATATRDEAEAGHQTRTAL